MKLEHLLGLHSQCALQWNHRNTKQITQPILLSILTYSNLHLSEIWQKILFVLVELKVSECFREHHSTEVDSPWVSICMSPNLESHKLHKRVTAGTFWPPNDVEQSKFNLFIPKVSMVVLLFEFLCFLHWNYSTRLDIASHRAGRINVVIWEVQWIKATQCPLVLPTPMYEWHLLYYFLSPSAIHNSSL